MKRTRSRILEIGLLLAGFILITGFLYVMRIQANSERWLNRAPNTRLQEARKTTVQGTVYDSEMTALAESPAAGVRRYIADRALRLAMSHTIGDQRGMSETGVENHHATTLLGMTDSTGTDKTLQTLMGDDPVGYDIVLTQNATLSAYIASLFPEDGRGACVVLNYKTGAILAKVSLPAFDPANPESDVVDTMYYDRALQWRYAPGSTFKTVTLVSALENLPGVSQERFFCNGEWSFADRTLHCAGGTVHGDISLQQAFTRSCNISFASLAYRLGAQQLRATSEKFGFNTEFHFDDIVLYASRCLKTSTAAGELIQAGFGQGATDATPLHMAMIAGAIANDGVMMEPKLIKEVRRHSGIPISTMQPKSFLTVTDPDTAKTTAWYMYKAVHDAGATGTRAQISGYSGYVCGKTGSAEVTSDKNALTNAWYIGFLYEDEQHPYAIAVVVEGGGSGGQTAAPLAAKALKRAMELGVY